MQQRGIGRGRGSTNLPTNRSLLQSLILHSSGNNGFDHQIQHPGSESRSDAGRNAPHRQLPRQRTIGIHQHESRYSPNTPCSIHAQVVQQGYAITNTNDPSNWATSGSHLYENAQSWPPTHQHVDIPTSNGYTSEWRIQTLSDTYSHFDDAAFAESAGRNSPGSFQEPDPICNSDEPWSSIFPRADRDPTSPVIPELQRLQRLDFGPFQTNATSNDPLIVPELPELPELSDSLLQDVNQSIHGFPQGYQEPSAQGEGRRLRRRTGSSSYSRTPRYPQPKQRIASSASIQNGRSYPTALSVEGPSIPSASTTTTSTSFIQCPHCSSCFTGRHGKGNLGRHIRQVHVSGPQSFKCEYALCERSYARKDARLKHYKKHHSDQDFHLLGLANP